MEITRSYFPRSILHATFGVRMLFEKCQERLILKSVIFIHYSHWKQQTPAHSDVEISRSTSVHTRSASIAIRSALRSSEIEDINYQRDLSYAVDRKIRYKYPGVVSSVRP